MSSNHFLSFITQDIDEIPRVIPAWKLEWRQLSRGKFCSKLKFAQLNDIELLYLSWSQAVQIQGNSPPETISFGIAISSQGRSIWRGMEYNSQDILINADQEVDLKVPAGYEMYTVTIKQERLLEYAEWQQRRLHQKDLEKTLGRVNAAVLSVIKAYLQSSFVLLELNPSYSQTYDSMQFISQDIVSLCITVLLSAEEMSPLLPQALQRAQLVKQLEQYMLAHLDQPLTIEHLCKVAGVRERSLNNYFRELLDMSPMAYFKALRLNRVRSVLKLADPTTDKVATLAKQYGFQHMGYFSVDYKAMFGESPSETLWRSVESVPVLQNFDSSLR